MFYSDLHVQQKLEITRYYGLGEGNPQDWPDRESIGEKDEIHFDSAYVFSWRNSGLTLQLIEER